MKQSYCQVQDQEEQEEEEEQIFDGGLDVLQRQGGEPEEDEEEAPGDGAHRRHVRDHDRGRGGLIRSVFHVQRQKMHASMPGYFQTFVSLLMNQKSENLLEHRKQFDGWTFDSGSSLCLTDSQNAKI